jgi:hypothetical protein
MVISSETPESFWHFLIGLANVFIAMTSLSMQTTEGRGIPEGHGFNRYTCPSPRAFEIHPVFSDAISQK